MIFYVLAGDETRTVSAEHEGNRGTQTINFRNSYTIPWLANDIKNRVDQYREGTGRTSAKISLLRMASHGNAGGHMFYNKLTIGTSPQFKVLNNYFEPHGRGIELWGCNVAAASTHDPGYRDSHSQAGQAHIARQYELLRNPSTSLSGSQTHPEFQRDRPTPSRLGVGYEFMRVLAFATNTNVTAAYDTQHRDTSEFQHRRVRWKWDGRGLLIVYPNGDFRLIDLK